MEAVPKVGQEVDKGLVSNILCGLPTDDRSPLLTYHVFICNVSLVAAILVEAGLCFLKSEPPARRTVAISPNQALLKKNLQSGYNGGVTFFLVDHKSILKWL